MTALINGDGTTEATWSPWLAEQAWPELDPAMLPAGRVVALAAHPDDEVLGVAGLLTRLAATGRDVVTIWATDGEASHPASTAVAPETLGRLRREESRAALRRLGVSPVAEHHLGLPDGRLDRHDAELRATLGDVVRPDDLVLAPWRCDGHPDHEALGRVAAELAPFSLLEYPVWMWHWATPGDPRVPWSRLRAAPVPDVTAKAAAVEEFVTQVQPLGPEPADAAILPPHVVARFLRPFESVFV